MAWSEDGRVLAEQVCSPQQLAALRLQEQGMGYKRSALVLGVGVDAVRGLVRRGQDNLRRALEGQAA